MCYEYGGPKRSYERLGIQQLHFPVVDHTEASLEHLKDAVAFIKQYRDRGEKVLVHCKAGHGRGASVALAWMMHEHPDMESEVCFTMRMYHSCHDEKLVTYSIYTGVE